ncbi:hypothetical protein [Streptomyces sp. NPDC005970]|uniref:hypothetical protein n=1 Tax=Streptomyces sp. NPDC005970 TaxID=3156723 RepID=UPI0033C210BA
MQWQPVQQRCQVRSIARREPDLVLAELAFQHGDLVAQGEADEIGQDVGARLLTEAGPDAIIRSGSVELSGDLRCRRIQEVMDAQRVDAVLQYLLETRVILVVNPSTRGFAYLSRQLPDQHGRLEWAQWIRGESAHQARGLSQYLYHQGLPDVPNACQPG